MVKIIVGDRVVCQFPIFIDNLVIGLMMLLVEEEEEEGLQYY